MPHSSGRAERARPRIRRNPLRLRVDLESQVISDLRLGEDRSTLLP